jgi:hypothetical protein
VLLVQILPDAVVFTVAKGWIVGDPYIGRRVDARPGSRCAALSEWRVNRPKPQTPETRCKFRVSGGPGEHPEQEARLSPRSRSAGLYTGHASRNGRTTFRSANGRSYSVPSRSANATQAMVGSRQ